MKNDKNGTRRKNMAKRLFVIAIVVMVIAGLVMYSRAQTSKKEVKYSEIVENIKDKDIKEIHTYINSNRIDITFNDGRQKFTYVPSIDEFWKYVNTQKENGNKFQISVERKPLEETTKVISSLLSMMLSIGFLFFLVKTAKGVEDFTVKPVTTNVRFADVAGIDEEREQLSEVVNFLREPREYTNMGARIPKGILLVGSPGTGKTLLAKAIAGEAGVPFFQVTGSSFEEKFVGIGASRVRKIFDEAKKVAPSIIFIDEIDSVAQNRFTEKSYSEQTLNQLLSEMDGFNSNNHIIVIAATNHKEILDPAILRPGRFDRHVYVPMPNVNAREEILKVHSKNKNISSEVNLRELAKKTVGFSGADLENVLNEAALLAVKVKSHCITPQLIDESVARVIIGIQKKNSPLSEEEKYRSAVHEAGHAIVSASIRPNVKNFCISIIPRGEAGGYNLFDQSNTTYHKKSDMEKQMQVMYGGRCAEEILLGDVSSGASSDLEAATNLAYYMVMNFAMAESKLVKIANHPEFNNYMESMSFEKMEEICTKAYEESLVIVSKNKEVISKLAALLMEKESLSDNEISAFLSENYIAQ